MNKILRYSFVALLAMVFGNISAQEFVFDFTDETNPWGFPTEQLKETGTFTKDGKSIVVTTTNYTRWFSDTKVLLFGKKDATITLPAFDFDVERIDVVGASGASAKVTFNIFVGDEAVSTEVTGAKETAIFNIAEGKQAAGTVYIIKNTNDNNNQIAKILIYKKGATPEPPSASVKYTKATTVQAGKKYMIVATKDEKLYAAKPVSGNYGYLQVIEVTDDNGVIMMMDDTNAFTFEAATGGYKIQQNGGKYLYLDETHNSFQVAESPTEGEIWTAVAQDNGTFKIANVLRNKYVQLDASYGTYGAYDAEKGSMPYLYLLDEGTSGINTIKANTDVNAPVYNLAGQQVEKSYKGLVIKNGKKIINK